jgi:general stress protein YciG
MLNLEHIDPKKSHLVSGLTDNEYNEIIADESYNKRKNNRFVPYRVCEYPAPVTFGDVGEFLIEGEWTVCEFGGPEWWQESNRVGNAHVEGGRKGIRSGKNTEPGVMRERGLKAVEVNKKTNTGVYGIPHEDRVEYGRKGGEASRDNQKGIHKPGVKTFETCSEGGKIGGRSGLNADPEHIRERGRRGGATQGPRNKGMAWYHQFDEDGNIVCKRSKTPLPDPWLPGRGKTK